MSAEEAQVPVISSMGAGNKLDPTMFEVVDIYKTSVCPLAKGMRKELKSRGVKKLKVVYSKEIAMKPLSLNKDNNDEVTYSGKRPAMESQVAILVKKRY